MTTQAKHSLTLRLQLSEKADAPLLDEGLLAFLKLERQWSLYRLLSQQRDL